MMKILKSFGIISFFCISTIFAGDIKPLFKVNIGHEFTDSEQTFHEIKDLIEKNYYSSSLQSKDLWWGAVKGMLLQISPKENKNLCTIWTPKQYKGIDQSLHGVQKSIGIKSSYNPKDGSLTVTSIMEHSPCLDKLKIYDRILRIDGKPLKNLPVTTINKMLKGEVGSEVTLKIVRDIEVFDLTVKRTVIKVENLQVQMLTQEIALISLKKFSTNISNEFKKALQEQKDAGVKKVIIDLRSNPGGIFTEGLKCAELFIAKGQKMMMMASHNNKINNYISTNKEPFKFELVVLINKNSASASEILAAALRDQCNATLVGTKSFGKATMERIYTLKNKYRVKFTNAALYSPKGKSWQKVGLKPDYTVKQELKTLNITSKSNALKRLTLDQQLKIAFQLLNK